MINKLVLPPEAVEAGFLASQYGFLVFPGDESPPTEAEERAEVFRVLTAAYPHLRRAILAAELPRIVAMAREDNYPEKVTWQDWKHTPASILAALEKGEA